MLRKVSLDLIYNDKLQITSVCIITSSKLYWLFSFSFLSTFQMIIVYIITCLVLWNFKSSFPVTSLRVFLTSNYLCLRNCDWCVDFFSTNLTETYTIIYYFVLNHSFPSLTLTKMRRGWFYRLPQCKYT